MSLVLPEDAPCHISLVAPQALTALLPSPSPRDNPFDSPPSSPPLPFYTAPSTPLTSPQQENPPMEAPMHQLSSPAPPSPPPTNPRIPPSCGIETIPPADVLLASDLALDLDDEGLSTLEKIYLFSRSRSAHHRYAQSLRRFHSFSSLLQRLHFPCPPLPPRQCHSPRGSRVCPAPFAKLGNGRRYMRSRFSDPHLTPFQMKP